MHPPPLHNGKCAGRQGQTEKDEACSRLTFDEAVVGIVQHHPGAVCDALLRHHCCGALGELAGEVGVQLARTRCILQETAGITEGPGKYLEVSGVENKTGVIHGVD